MLIPKWTGIAAIVSDCRIMLFSVLCYIVTVISSGICVTNDVQVFAAVML